MYITYKWTSSLPTFYTFHMWINDIYHNMLICSSSCKWLITNHLCKYSRCLCLSGQPWLPLIVSCWASWRTHRHHVPLVSSKKSYKPPFSLDSSWSGTWWNPEHRSIVLKYFFPCITYFTSSIEAIAMECLTVTAFSFLWCTQNRRVPSFFFMSTMGDGHFPVIRKMRSCSTIWSMCLLISGFSPIGTLYFLQWPGKGPGVVSMTCWTISVLPSSQMLSRTMSLNSFMRRIWVDAKLLSSNSREFAGTLPLCLSLLHVCRGSLALFYWFYGSDYCFTWQFSEFCTSIDDRDSNAAIRHLIHRTSNLNQVSAHDCSP